MDDRISELAGRRPKTFGRRKVMPRACVADGKSHLRAFLSEVLEDLGFVTSECAKADELQAMLATDLPDLILLGIAVDGIEPGKISGDPGARGVRRQGARRRRPRVDHRQGRAAGRRGIRPCDAAAAHHALCRRRRCASASRCCCPRSRHRARPCMSARPCMPAGSNSGTSRRSTPARWSAAAPRRWCGCGIRPGAWCRRPISSRKSDDPHFRDLSEFVIERAMQDWHYLLEQQSPVDHLDQPAGLLSQGAAGGARSLPPDADASGIRRAARSRSTAPRRSTISNLLIDVAREMRLHNIAPVDRQSRRQLAGADGARQHSPSSTQGRPAIRHRLRQRPAEADGVPSHRRARARATACASSPRASRAAPILSPRTSSASTWCRAICSASRCR